MLPERSARPAGTGTAVAPDRLEQGGTPLLVASAPARVVVTDAAAGRLLGPTGGGPREPLTERARVPGGLVAAVPFAGHPERWLAVTGRGFVTLREGGEAGEAEPVPGVPVAAACDPSGRVWALTGRGAVLRRDPDGRTVQVTAVPAPVPPAPGALAFSPHGATLYAAGGQAVHAVDLDPEAGTAHGTRVLAEVPARDGHVAGLAADGLGRVWCALWDGGAVRCLGPDGRTLITVPLPAVRPSGLCLTGRTMLVATARAGPGEAGELDGALLETVCTAPAPRPVAAATG